MDTKILKKKLSEIERDQILNEKTTSYLMIVIFMLMLINLTFTLLIFLTIIGF